MDLKKVVPQPAPVMPVAAPVAAVVDDFFIDRVPSNWDIKPCEKGIVAVSTRTNEQFEGPIKEFNRRIKG